MTAIEIHKELIGDESGLPLTRNTLREGELTIPQIGTFDIRHSEREAIVSAPRVTVVLPEGSNIVIGENRELRWRVVHRSKLPR